MLEAFPLAVQLLRSFHLASGANTAFLEERGNHINDYRLDRPAQEHSTLPGLCIRLQNSHMVSQHPSQPKTADTIPRRTSSISTLTIVFSPVAKTNARVQTAAKMPSSSAAWGKAPTWPSASRMGLEAG